MVVVVESSPSGFSTGVERAAAQGARRPGGGPAHKEDNINAHHKSKNVYLSSVAMLVHHDVVILTALLIPLVIKRV